MVGVPIFRVVEHVDGRDAGIRSPQLVSLYLPPFFSVINPTASYLLLFGLATLVTVRERKKHFQDYWETRALSPRP